MKTKLLENTFVRYILVMAITVLTAKFVKLAYGFEEAYVWQLTAIAVGLVLATFVMVRRGGRLINAYIGSLIVLARYFVQYSPLEWKRGIMLPEIEYVSILSLAALILPFAMARRTGPMKTGTRVERYILAIVASLSLLFVLPPLYMLSEEMVWKVVAVISTVGFACHVAMRDNGRYRDAVAAWLIVMVPQVLAFVIYEYTTGSPSDYVPFVPSVDDVVVSTGMMGLMIIGSVIVLGLTYVRHHRERPSRTKKGER